MEVNQMEVKMELSRMEVNQMEVKIELERELNRMELNKMEVKYSLKEVIGWQDSDYEKEDYELDLAYADNESESCERSL